jgi:hypothetical protein
MPNTDLYAFFVIVSCITVIFICSVLLSCLSWYFWGGYRSIDTDPVKTKRVIDNINEKVELETNDINEDK